MPKIERCKFCRRVRPEFISDPTCPTSTSTSSHVYCGWVEEEIAPPPPAIKGYEVHPAFDEGGDEDCIRCPYCLYEEGDPWEYALGNRTEVEFECPECEQVSMVTIETTVTYEAHPIDPAVPRRAFPVTLWFEGWSKQVTLYPYHTPIGIIIMALVSRGRDPFLDGADHVGQWVVWLSGGETGSALNDSPLQFSTPVVKQGVRPGHHLYIKRKLQAFR